MTGKLDASVVAGVVLLTLIGGPAAYAAMRRLEVSAAAATQLVAAVMALALASLFAVASLVGARSWTWSATWCGVDWGLSVGASTLVWWWPLAAAAALVASRSLTAWQQGASRLLAGLAVALTVVAATPGTIAAGLLLFAAAMSLEYRAGRLRVVACALAAAWVVLELTADAHAVGIEQPVVESLADVARPYRREVALMWVGMLASVGLVPANLDGSPGRSGAFHLLGLTMATRLAVRIFAPSLALGLGEWAQLLAWVALGLMVVGAARAGTQDEHGGVFGFATGLMILGVCSLRTEGLVGASAAPALLGVGLVARELAGPVRVARIAPVLALSIAAAACIAGVFSSKSTFETPGLLAVLAVLTLAVFWAGASRAQRQPPRSPQGHAVAVAVLCAFGLGLQGTLNAASLERRVETEIIARTRCARLETRGINGLALVVPTTDCRDPDTELRTRYPVWGHARPGGGG